MGYIKADRDFHEARWDEPIIMELGNPGERGILVPMPSEKIKKEAGEPERLVPEGMLRRKPPELPEMSQMQVLRHYMRLSQETLGADINIDIGLGTCTMKYSPKVHEQLARDPMFTEIHPYQDESTLQGILEIFYKVQDYLKAISGMDHVCLQPSGGSQAIFHNMEVVKAYHKSRGEDAQRNEVITTMLSHPANPGAAATLGYKVITLMPGPDGVPELDALKSVLSEHTAALLVTNPEDTGIYNDKIKQFVDLVHDAGGLCIYDQANLNGVFGITRARDAGFDMCHYNLHKSFSSPHGCQGPAAGASCMTKELAPFAAVPAVACREGKYHLDYDRPLSVGKLRKFYGAAGVILRTYAYIRSLGPDGMKQIGELSILNNNYLIKKLLEIPRLSMPMADGRYRLEQARFSWEKLTQDTGVTTDDIARRIVDYGFQDYFASHEPRIIPEPFTPEPTETYSKDDIDEYVEALKKIAEEAYRDPELVKSAPHKAALAHQIRPEGLTSWENFATTWRAYRKFVKNNI